MPELRLSIRLDSFDISGNKIPLKQSLLAAARLGARGVEIDARNGIRPQEVTDTAARQIRKIMDDLNLRVSSVRFSTRRGYDIAADLDRRIDATKQAMRLAYALGASHVINQIGHVPSDSESAAWQQLRSALEDLGRYGAHVGAFLAAETGTEGGDSLSQLLDSLQNAFVSVAFNPGQLILGGFPVLESLQALGSKVGLLIAQDGVQDLSRGRGIDVPIGQGTADFPEILGSLEDWQFRGWVVVGRAHCGAEEVKAGMNYLSNL